MNTNFNKQQQTGSQNKFENLEKYSRNLIQAARQGKLDPVIGRDDEIRRILQILSRRTKNNPILIGEPGTGKTAIVEGLAQRIVRGDVPENLKEKLVYSLDMGALVAGAMYKGEFEDRLKKVVNEVIESNGQIILFIDEIHTLVGAGKGDGAMDAANILKPALARGELRSIGATTLDEYQKYFEKDKALERRFQTIIVDEPDEQAAISILRGLKEKYEGHHKVRIKDEACIAAVKLSTRYISDRFLPDKAIDLIDEAAAKLRMERDSVPEEIDELVRKIQQLEIEREAIRRENDTDKEKLLTEEINSLKVKEYELRTQWDAEREVANKIQQNKEQIEKLKLEAEQAERDGNYARVAEIRYGILKKLEEDIEKQEQQAVKPQNSTSVQPNKMVRDEVTADDIAEVVSRWTGIPVARMMQSEREKLLHIEEELHQRVVGQQEGIDAVANAIRRSRAGLQDAKRPIASFLFLGSTGIGKTELAKALAEYLFNDETMMTRIDMSEYQEKHTVSRLIGAPPGYIGYEEGGQLTEAVRRKPYSVVLFDEIEKAHPDVFNTLLQVLDDGRLTDNKGRTVNFKNTIIVMTSNLGSQLINEYYDNLNDNVNSNFNSDSDKAARKSSPYNNEIEREKRRDALKENILTLLKQNVRPEFLNRIDETILFERLNKEEVRQVVELQITQLYRLLKEQDIEIRVTPEAIDYIAKKGYDPEFGARPVKRAIQHHLLNQLSKDILGGKINTREPIVVKVSENGLRFNA